MKRFAAFLLVFLGLSAFAAEPVCLPRTSTLQHTAKANGIDYKIYVSLPRDYERSKERYPVIYSLDADYSFAIAHNVVEHLADRDHLRWAIVVSIAYDGPPAYRVNRTRDYTPTHTLEGGYGPEYQKHSGGGPKFLQFIDEELIPLVEANYRTTDERVLAGHSYGGLFATWVLMTRPELFDGYVIVSPSFWFDKELIFKIEKTVKNPPKARVYLTAGSIENPIMANDVRRMGAALKRHRNLEVKSEVLPDETHNSIFPGAFSRGLRYVMKGR